MKKKAIATLLSTALAASAVCGFTVTANAADYSDKTFSIIIRNAGNPYAEKKLPDSRKSLRLLAQNVLSKPRRPPQQTNRFL